MYVLTTDLSQLTTTLVNDRSFVDFVALEMCSAKHVDESGPIACEIRY
jgi:hypothetical protein